jgi:hypothetical protein
MPALRELQAAIGAAMLGGDMGAAAREIEGDGLAPEARLELYRHHVRTTLTSALEATFPVVCRLVDRRFFAYAADAYLRAHPPIGPCLFEYGETFPEFLAAFPPCRGLSYLPDVARLEWAMNAALHAPDVDAIDPAGLGRVAPEDMPRLTFAFDPSVSYLESQWPVDRICHTHQDGAAAAAGASGDLVASGDPIDLGSGGARIEVRRALELRDALADDDHGPGALPGVPRLVSGGGREAAQPEVARDAAQIPGPAQSARTGRQLLGRRSRHAAGGPVNVWRGSSQRGTGGREGCDADSGFVAIGAEANIHPNVGSQPSPRALLLNSRCGEG